MKVHLKIITYIHLHVYTACIHINIFIWIHAYNYTCRYTNACKYICNYKELEKCNPLCLQFLALAASPYCITLICISAPFNVGFKLVKLLQLYQVSFKDMQNQWKQFMPSGNQIRILCIPD